MATTDDIVPVSWVVYVLVIWFGVGSWLSVNCLWVELPVIVEQLPEQWRLPSYLTVIIQVANIGPILIAIINKLYPRRVNQKLLICHLLTIGVVATFLLSFLWSETSIIAGTEYSLGLFILVFFIAFVNCSSSVAFIPYMAVFRHEYLTAYFIGSGLSGLLPAILSLSQGIGGNNDCVNRTIVNATHVNDMMVNDTGWVLEPVPNVPNFSARSFFIAITVFMLMSTAAFIALITWPVALQHQNQGEGNARATPKPSDGDMDVKEKLSLETPGDNNEADDGGGGYQSAPATNVELTSAGFEGSRNMPLATFIYLLLLVCVINGLSNTALYSVQTYSCLPYGNIAYHLSVVLSGVANPVGAFIPFWIATTSPLAITALTMIACAISSYIFLTAAMSPQPPLVDYDSGKALVILSWTLVVGLLTYIKTLLAGALRTEGRFGLLWCGILTQLGSAIGAFTLFPLVNIYNVFQGSYTCNSIKLVN